jgi:hypothetical protein
MGERDSSPSANFSAVAQSHWAGYAAGKANVGQRADPADWRIARTIFVADDDKPALRYGRRRQQPLPILLAHDGKKMRFSGPDRLQTHRAGRCGTHDDYLVERLVLCAR